MLEIWNNWSGFEQLMISIAVIFTTLFIIQVLLTILGAGVEHLDALDVNADFDDGSIGFFTIRNMISFLSCLGWTGFVMKKNDFSELTSFICAVFVGFIAMSLNFLLLRSLSKLSENNTFDLNNTIGSTAKVYTPVSKDKPGIVLINYGGGSHQVNARSDQDISSHTSVVVKEVIGPNFVFVEPL